MQDDVSTHVFMSIDTLSLIEVMMMSILMREKEERFSILLSYNEVDSVRCIIGATL